MAGTVWAIQRDGSRIPIENWLYEAWRRGEVTDPFLLAPLQSAVRFNLTPGWPSPKTDPEGRATPPTAHEALPGEGL